MPKTDCYDAVVIGAGILGLASAYHLAKAGLKVKVIERGAKAVGASIRNFGMVWPIGQPRGEMRDIALRSRSHWLTALGESGIWHERSGSLHLAYSQDELAVLEEFVSGAQDWNYECGILSPADTLAKSPQVRPNGLCGSMWSPTELCVFPRQVVWELPGYLESLGVNFQFGSAVTRVESGRVWAAGSEIETNKVMICSGDDFETLFPQHFSESGLTRSKLQMMRARPKIEGFKLNTHLCAGLTLGHYANFRVCQGLQPLLERFEREYPEHQRWGIHLLVSQHEDGCLTIGDSHEYGLEVTPFLREEIDRLILGYLNTFLPVEHLEVTERWFGVYAKHPSKHYVIDEVAKDVLLVTGVGGAGMTLSFGITEKALTDAGWIDPEARNG